MEELKAEIMRGIPGGVGALHRAAWIDGMWVAPAPVPVFFAGSFGQQEGAARFAATCAFTTQDGKHYTKARKSIFPSGVVESDDVYDGGKVFTEVHMAHMYGAEWDRRWHSPFDDAVPFAPSVPNIWGRRLAWLDKLKSRASAAGVSDDQLMQWVDSTLPAVRHVTYFGGN